MAETRADAGRSWRRPIDWGLPWPIEWVEDARMHLCRMRLLSALDRLLGAPEIVPAPDSTIDLARTWDLVHVRVRLLAAGGRAVRVPLWQAWDVQDLDAVVRGMVAFAAIHEAMELVRHSESFPWDPHGPLGDVVPFASVMRGAGAKFWLLNGG